MAETKNEKLHIRLHVYDEDIDVTVERSEEEYYRAAAKLITDRYNVYAQIYKGRKSDASGILCLNGVEKLPPAVQRSLMTLIDIALQHQKERSRNDVEPFEKILTRLTADIDEVLGDKRSK